MSGFLLIALGILVGAAAADALIESALSAGTELRFVGAPITELRHPFEPLVIAGLGAVLGALLVVAIARWRRSVMLRRFVEERRRHEHEFWAATERVRARRVQLENDMEDLQAAVERLRLTRESMRRESTRIADRAATLESSLARSRDALLDLDQVLLVLRDLPETVGRPVGDGAA